MVGLMSYFMSDISLRLALASSVNVFAIGGVGSYFIFNLDVLLCFPNPSGTGFTAGPRNSTISGDIIIMTCGSSGLLFSGVFSLNVLSALSIEIAAKTMELQVLCIGGGMASTLTGSTLTDSSEDEEEEEEDSDGSLL